MMKSTIRLGIVISFRRRVPTTLGKSALVHQCPQVEVAAALREIGAGQYSRCLRPKEWDGTEDAGGCDYFPASLLGL
jgi:hypothetical protein